jgi:hypothetical protein
MIFISLFGSVLACAPQVDDPPVAVVSSQETACDPQPYLQGVDITDLNKNPVSSISPNSQYYVRVCGQAVATCLTLSTGAVLTNDPPGTCLDNGFPVPYAPGDIGTTYYEVTTTDSSGLITGYATPIDSCADLQPQFNMNFIVPGSGGCEPPPLPRTGLLLWLRADAGVTSSGGRVSRWLDQSGNGFVASMTAAARQPSFVGGALNGQPVIRFSGAQSLGLSPFVSPTRFTVLVVGKNSNTSETFSMILGPGGNAPNNQLRWENGSQALLVGTGNNLPVTTSNVGNTRAYHTLSATYDGTTMYVFYNGTATSGNNFTTTGPWTLAQIGAWYSTYFMNGDVAEILMYDHALSGSDLSGATAYLRSKYNLP